MIVLKIDSPEEYMETDAGWVETVTTVVVLAGRRFKGDLETIETVGDSA
jgi:hypothetical protein